ncbi:uncharacterized protein MELLADRAFT_113495 [Melampsora larici-populina 98AG31]|uniref:Uncharacterized protein n=1 Tax=Melampsora larici-populina (strain 98AG31 / pathotype 3-4-7) TaxID=747676 RepID=F4SA37_MELLP|nr:uncharacterized protein MELLADRAFT_113495 [Melampsora larici-populina 98AG31]EGF98507.1 hypothetical protein MELLADRAFT_113495 [Melampsora larici-populina 98AG31]
MEAKPTQTQTGPTQSTQSGQNNEKRQTNYKDNDQNSGSDTESRNGSDDDSDGELTFEESKSRQRKKAARSREETKSRRRDAMMADLADAPDIPNAASQISQEIHEYVQMLMGISRKSQSIGSNKNSDPTLPPPPSQTEMNTWITSDIRIAGEPNVRLLWPCLDSLAVHLTEKLDTSLPGICQCQQLSSTSGSSVLTHVLMKTPAGREKVAADTAYSKKLISRPQTKKAIYDAQKSVAVAIFGADSGEAEIISQRDIHSEDKLSSSTPSKVRCSWRSAKLDTLISLIDQCVWARETVASARRSAHHLVEHGPYNTTPDFDIFPPQLFQRSLVLPTWIASMSGVAVRNLKLATTNKVDILRSIEKLTKELASSSTSQ